MHDFASVVVRCTDFWSVTESVTDEAESEACNPVMREENHLFGGDVSVTLPYFCCRCWGGSEQMFAFTLDPALIMEIKLFYVV